MNECRNRLLIGVAEEIDLIRPDVRKMLKVEGIYLASDTDNPGYTVPLVVLNGRVHSMCIDSELDPERFKSTVLLAGPFYAPSAEPSETES